MKVYLFLFPLIISNLASGMYKDSYLSLLPRALYTTMIGQYMEEQANEKIYETTLEANFLAGLNGQDKNWGAFALAIAPQLSQKYLIKLCEAGKLDQVKCVLEKGINPNCEDGLAATPLIVAADNGNLEMVRLLLDHGANVNFANSFGETALMIAAREAHLEMVKELFAKKADIHARDNKGNTLLSYLICNSRLKKKYDIHLLDTIAFFLLRKIDINVQNENGNTALMIAVNKKYMKVVKLLVWVGADRSIVNNYGQTVFELRPTNSGINDILLKEPQKVVL